MKVRFFGTYDERRHPRVGVLREGVAATCSVQVVNRPVPIDTAMRIEALRSPARLLPFVPLLLGAWLRLALASLRRPRADVVVVGHLGHLDVLLARLLHPRATIVLDYLISLADTARDRGVGDRGLVLRALTAADRLATRVADVVVVDTPESLDTVPPSQRRKVVVVPVGADASWFDAAEVAADHTREGPLSLVFFGLYTPLQGAPTIGAALQLLHERGVDVTATMVGDGQDRAATERACPDADVTWLDWVPSAELPALVASHDVCLGIFGTGDKALRVVPNKAYQGAAAGCLVVTSDTAPQRRALPTATLVPPGDAEALAGALAAVATELDGSEAAATSREAADEFRAEAVVAPLLDALQPPSADTVDLTDTDRPRGVPMATQSALHPPLTPMAWLRHDQLREALADLPSEARVLEVGAGQGAWAVRLARAFDYTGIEADEDAAATARARLEASGLPHRLHVDRFEDVDLEPPYDAVCAFEVLEHIGDDEAALRSWVQLLAPGGRVLLSVPAWQERFGPMDERVGHFRRYSPDGLAALLRGAGLVDVHVQQYGFPLGFVLEAVRNRLADRAPAAPVEERTAESGRLYQPSASWTATATDVATRPFRALQRAVGGDRRGTGIVATGRLPA